MDVRTICLGILTRGDATGYEIKKLFEDDGYQHFVEASFGSIYPALNRLTEEGLVSVRQAAAARSSPHC
jgi:PadR family transcriptional regulator AphA